MNTSGKLIFFLLLLFIPYIALCFFAHPIADDFRYILWGNYGGYWPYQLHDFLHWNGRYSSNLLVMLDPIKWHSLAGYRIAAFSLLLLTPLACYFLIDALIHKNYSTEQKLIASFLFSALFLGLTPDLPEAIYWYTGSITYHLASLMACIYAGLAIRYISQRYIINKGVHLAITVVTLFMAIGFNEVIMLMLLAGHLITFIAFRKEKPVLFLSLFTFIFSLIMILAPGNSGRSSYFTNNHQLVNSLYMTALQMIRFGAQWVLYAPMLLASILFVCISDKLCEYSPIFAKLASLKLWQAFSILCLILFLCIFPAYWNTGILGQHRTLNAACFVFIPFWFLFVHIAAKRLPVKNSVLLLSEKVQKMLLLLFMACLLLSGNSGKALTEFVTGKITGFNNEMKQRYTLLATAHHNGLNEITLPILKNRPESLYVLDIQPGCTSWINSLYGSYFGVEKVCADSVTTK